jgi:hypothetical protein
MQSKLNEIEVDPNFQLSEDAKWGHELAKNPVKWYQYFNTQLPANAIKTSIFEDDDEFDKLFQ